MRAVFLDQKTLAEKLDWAGFALPQVEWLYYDNCSSTEIAERIADADIVLTNKVPLDASTIANAPKLKLICVAATGVDRIDLAAAKAHNIKVCNVANYSTPSVVQQVFCLMLNLMTQQLAYVNDVKQGRWQTSELFCLQDHDIHELSGKTLGIVGYGAIGQQVAMVAQAFGMNVIFTGSERTQKKFNAPSLHEMLPDVDVLSLHCPLTAETNQLIGAKELELMKPSAILINTARGAIIDEDALYQALTTGQIKAAGLDVLSEEPPQATHPLLKNLPNLLLTPHVAWASLESQQRLLDSLKQSISDFLAGKAIHCAVS